MATVFPSLTPPAQSEQPQIPVPRVGVVSVALFPLVVKSRRLGGHVHLELDPKSSAVWEGYKVREAESPGGMGLELYRGKEVCGSECLKKGLRTAEVANWQCQTTRLPKLMCLEGVGMEEERRRPASWYKELVFLCSGNKGSLHLCFHQIRYSLSLFFFPSWVVFIPARLALLGWGRGRRRKQL